MPGRRTRLRRAAAPSRNAHGCRLHRRSAEGKAPHRVRRRWDRLGEVLTRRHRRRLDIGVVQGVRRATPESKTSLFLKARRIIRSPSTARFARCQSTSCNAPGSGACCISGRPFRTRDAPRGAAEPISAIRIAGARPAELTLAGAFRRPGSPTVCLNWIKSNSALRYQNDDKA